VDAARDAELVLDGKPLREALMESTRIYVRSILALLRELPEAVKGLAHITGGGLRENVPRILPEPLAAHIDLGSWPRPALFRWLQEQGEVAEAEMTRVFNCGIGMVLVVAPEKAGAAEGLLRAQGETVYRIGEVVPRVGDEAAGAHRGLASLKRLLQRRSQALRRVRRKGVEAAQLGPGFAELAQPRELAFGQLPRGGDPGVDHGFAPDRAFEVVPDLAIAHGAHGRVGKGEVRALP